MIAAITNQRFYTTAVGRGRRVCFDARLFTRSLRKRNKAAFTGGLFLNSNRRDSSARDLPWSRGWHGRRPRHTLLRAAFPHQQQPDALQQLGRRVHALGQEDVRARIALVDLYLS